MTPIPYGKHHITQDDIEEVVKTLHSDYITQGPKVQEFEQQFADYVGSDYAVAVANGTAALHLSALALDVDENTNVITTPVTFAATANCIRFCGGRVTLADIDPETGTLDIKEVRKLLEEAPEGRYDGIIPVDLAGYPVNMEEFQQLADEYNLWILEDACHAPGGYFIDRNGNKQYCGNGMFSDLAIFSFHPVKHIAAGEGGMITTNDESLYEKLKLLRTHGITKDPDQMSEYHGGWYYEMQELGYNYRLSDIHAALGLSQLQRANENLEKRRALAKRYDEAFEDTTIEPLTKEVEGHAYHLYVIQAPERNTLFEHLHAHDILVQVHYIPLHYLPYYQQRLGNVDLPHAEQSYKQCLSLPMYPTLSEKEQDFVIEKILAFYNS
jgi:UDP-4-amino-4,6-dideoxy-N-acetyl-beta-L-altrosamine transaminase